MVLLVIDAQKLITNERLYKFELFVQTVKKLIRSARHNQIEVIYIRHDDGEGAALTKGKEGYEIFEGFGPLENEKVFDKTVNSVFRDTGLLEYLREKGEEELIITGLQTDYCVDASVKCAFEHGFGVIVPEHANTTTDNGFMTGEESYNYYNEFIWNSRYAACISVEETLEWMREG